MKKNDEIKRLEEELNSLLETKRKRDNLINSISQKFKNGEISEKAFLKERKETLWGYSMFCSRIREIEEKLLILRG